MMAVVISGTGAALILLVIVVLISLGWYFLLRAAYYAFLSRPVHLLIAKLSNKNSERITFAVCGTCKGWGKTFFDSKIFEKEPLCVTRFFSDKETCPECVGLGVFWMRKV